MFSPLKLITQLEASFLQAADSTLAGRQSAYMRLLFPFIGLSKPVRTRIQKELFASHRIQTQQELFVCVHQLWEKEQREFQYAALDLVRKYHSLWSIESLTHFEEMIRQKSWWDTVDIIASNLVGKLVLRFPRLALQMDQWIEDEDLWIRRTALLFQLGWKEKTQARQLFSYCQKTMHERDFFIRKAIGWSLRQYSKFNPEAVQVFIDQHRTSLSPLSIREGSRLMQAKAVDS